LLWATKYRGCLHLRQGCEMMLNILVACKTEKAPDGLEFVGEHCVLYDTHASWGVASNNLLDQAAELGGDALFLDDDVTLTPGCLDVLRVYAHAADIFGLDLHDMTGARQAGARHVMDTSGVLHDWVQPGPAYVAHCSTSAIYIKQDVLHANVRFPIWDGIHWEDVAFCLDAWLHGFRLLAVPGYVHHNIVGGAGATKRHAPEFWEKWAKNRQYFGAWMGEKGVMQALADGRVPVGAQTIEGVIA